MSRKTNIKTEASLPISAEDAMEKAIMGSTLETAYQMAVNDNAIVAKHDKGVTAIASVEKLPVKRKAPVKLKAKAVKPKPKAKAKKK